MALRLFGHFLQNSYVTSNMDMAKGVFAEEYGVRQYADIDNAFEIETPTGTATLDLKIALAFIDNLQVELIQPLGGSGASIYTCGFPQEEFYIRFHHASFMLPGPLAAWYAFRDQVDQLGITVAMEADLGIVRFCYLDTRKTTGHYCEYTWAAEDIQSQVPRN